MPFKVIFPTGLAGDIVHIICKCALMSYIRAIDEVLFASDMIVGGGSGMTKSRRFQ